MDLPGQLQSLIFQSGRLPLGASSSIAAASGVLSHLLYFIRGHHVPYALLIVQFYSLAGVTMFAVNVWLYGLARGAIEASFLASAYFLALFTSMLIYRVFFHPLRRFPGPFAAKLTKLYGPYLNRNGKMHFEHGRLHDKYGDFVRMGPNELFIFSVDGLLKVSGGQSKCTKKDTVYEAVSCRGEQNLDSILSREEHRPRRHIWDQAMSSKALEHYETCAHETVNEWLQKLQELEGKPVDTTLCSLLIPFETMGRMGFSKSFGSIKTGKEDAMLHSMEITYGSVGQLGQLSWPLVLLQGLGVSGPHTIFENLTIEMTNQRMAATGEHHDIIEYMLRDYRSDKPTSYRNINTVYADAQLIIIAGTDTIGATLAYTFYYLARDKAVRDKVREELRPLFGKSVPGQFAEKDLRSAAYLEAVIDEALRLHNPTCNSGPRTVPPGGIVVDGEHVPAGTLVVVPTHSLQRSSKYFQRPDEFIPERWTTSPELVIDKRAFQPFHLGTYNCVGRRVGWIVLRLAIASTVWNYDFEFAPGEDGVAIERDAVNQLILKAGKLECVFTKVS